MANILIITGTVYGGAQFVAEQVQELLQGEGHTVTLTESPTVQCVKSPDNDTLLVISSTTGQGDLPDNLVSFHNALKDEMPLIPHKRYCVIALGDSSYGATFCGGGKLMDEIFTEIQAVKLGEVLQIDACETLQPEDAAVPWAEEWAKLL